MQSLPPCAGAGLTQRRARAVVPDSHVAEHVAQDAHKDHPPSTERIACFKWYTIVNSTNRMDLYIYVTV